MVLTRSRIISAFTVAIVADVVQVMLGPLGWTFADEIIDIAAMVVMVWLLGFHPMLLPTFIIELIPVIDMLPTWTGCVAAVVMLKRRPGPVEGTAPTEPDDSSVSAGPIYSETGQPQPPPRREPRNISGGQ